MASSDTQLKKPDGWLSTAEITGLCIGRRFNLKQRILAALASPDLPLQKQECIMQGKGEKKPHTYVSPAYFSWLVEHDILHLRQYEPPSPNLKDGEQSALSLSYFYIGGDVTINESLKAFAAIKAKEMKAKTPAAHDDHINAMVSSLYVGMRKPKTTASCLYATKIAIDELEKLGWLKRRELAAGPPAKGELSVHQLTQQFEGGNVRIKVKLEQYEAEKIKEVIKKHGYREYGAKMQVHNHFVGLRKAETGGAESYYVTQTGLAELQQRGILKPRNPVGRAEPDRVGAAYLSQAISSGMTKIQRKLSTYRAGLLRDIKYQFPNMENVPGIVDEHLIGDRIARNGNVSPHASADAVRAMVHEGYLKRKDGHPEMPDAELAEIRSASAKIAERRARKNPVERE